MNKIELKSNKKMNNNIIELKKNNNHNEIKSDKMIDKCANAEFNVTDHYRCVRQTRHHMQNIIKTCY